MSEDLFLESECVQVRVGSDLDAVLGLPASISVEDEDDNLTLSASSSTENPSKRFDVIEDMKPVKRIKLQESAGVYSSQRENSLKEILKNIYKAITLRLNGIDKKVNEVFSQCHLLETKMKSVTDCLCERGVKFQEGLPTNDHLGYSSVPSSSFTLNSESDYPNGAWLGDENDPERRVRCRISPDDLSVINCSCHTAEKLALTLLDYLFDRETQACSNISGHGRHGKKQLDPLIIYGIKCHLIHRFNISESDWHKIRLNLDSKCRTAFRRKLKGMPLTVKAFRGADTVGVSSSQLRTSRVTDCKTIQSSDIPSTLSILSTPTFITPILDVNESNGVCVLDRNVKLEDEDNLGSHAYRKEDAEETFLTLDDKGTLVDLADNHTYSLELGFEIEHNSQIIHTLQGEIQVLHATPEQLAEIQKSGKIQILTSNQVLQEVQEAKLDPAWETITEGFTIESQTDTETR